jgi:hypothetical protein
MTSISCSGGSGSSKCEDQDDNNGIEQAAARNAHRTVVGNRKGGGNTRQDLEKSTAIRRNDRSARRDPGTDMAIGRSDGSTMGEQETSAAIGMKGEATAAARRERWWNEVTENHERSPG